MSAPLRKAARRPGAPPSGSARDADSSPPSPSGASSTAPAAWSAGGIGAADPASGGAHGTGGPGAGGGRLFRRGLGGTSLIGGSAGGGGGMGSADSHLFAMSVAAGVEERARAGDGAAVPAGGRRPVSSTMGSSPASTTPGAAAPASVGLASSVPTRHRVSGLASASGAHAHRRESVSTSRTSTPTGSVASLPSMRGKHGDGGGGGGVPGTGDGSSTNVGGLGLDGGGGSSGPTLSMASSFVPLPTRLRLSDGISCMDYHPTFRALAVGGTRQIHVVEVGANVAMEVCEVERRHRHTVGTSSASSAAGHSAATTPLPSLASATAPFGFRNAGTFGGLVKVESVVWYPSAAEATLAFVQPSRFVTILLDVLAFKADGSYIPQQWIRSRCKTLTAPVAAGSGSTTTAVMIVPGSGMTARTTTTSVGSASAAFPSAANLTAQVPRAAAAVPASASGSGGHRDGGALPTTAGGTSSSTSSTTAPPSGPSVQRGEQRPSGRELIELNIDITYMRVEKIVWDPHTPYTLALTSPLTLFELWQVPVHGSNVYAPQLILRPPAHTARVTVRDIEFSPSDPNLIVVMVETASAGQLLLFDRRQVEIPRHVDVMGPALAAVFHPIFADLLAVCYRKEKAKTDCRIAFLRVMQDDDAGVLDVGGEMSLPAANHTAGSAAVLGSGRASTGFIDRGSTSSLGSPLLASSGAAADGGSSATFHTPPVAAPRYSGVPGTSASPLLGSTSSVTALQTPTTPAATGPSGWSGAEPIAGATVTAGARGSGVAAPAYPHVRTQDVLPPIDYYACVNRLLWRPTSCGQLCRSRIDHPWLTFVPDAQAVLQPPTAVGTETQMGNGHVEASRAQAPSSTNDPPTASALKTAVGYGSHANHSSGGSGAEVDVSLLASQLWFATSAIANDTDVHVWDAANGYLPVCSVQYPTRDGREATNDFVWINEVTLVSAVRGNEIVVSSLLGSTHLDRTVQSALQTGTTTAGETGAPQRHSPPRKSEEDEKTEAAAHVPAAHAHSLATALSASGDTASRISTLYAFLPTSSIAASWFGHVIAVRNSAATVRRHYSGIMRRECVWLIRRLVMQLKHEHRARRLEWEQYTHRLAQPSSSTAGGAVAGIHDSLAVESKDTAEESLRASASLSPSPSSPVPPAAAVASPVPAAVQTVATAASTRATSTPSFFAKLFGMSSHPQPHHTTTRNNTARVDSASPTLRPSANTPRAAPAPTARRCSPTFPARRPFPSPSAAADGIHTVPHSAHTAGATDVVGRPAVRPAPPSLSPVAAAEKSRTFVCLFPLLAAQQRLAQTTRGAAAAAASKRGGSADGARTQPSSPTLGASDAYGRSPTLDEGTATRASLAARPHRGLVEGTTVAEARREAALVRHTPLSLGEIGTRRNMSSLASFSTVDPASVGDVTALTGAAVGGGGSGGQAPPRLESSASARGFSLARAGMQPNLEAFVVSDVVCNWAYTERETEQLKFMAYALEWDMGYELALSMKRLRRFREDLVEVMAATAAQQPQSQQASAINAMGGADGECAWHRGERPTGLPTSRSRRALAEDDPSWTSLRKGLLAHTAHERGRGPRDLGMGLLDAGGGSGGCSLFTTTQVDDLFAAMMLKNAATCAQQESWVGGQQRVEAHAMNAAAPLSTRAAGKVRAVTSDPRAQWWRSVAHAWRTHNLPFILAVTIGQLEYASLTGDVQYCTVLYILFCLWWRLRHEESSAPQQPVASAASARDKTPMTGAEMATHVSGAAAMDPAAVQRAWTTHGARLREEVHEGRTHVLDGAPSAARATLTSGAPCPLCPAPDRPVPQGTTPQAIPDVDRSDSRMVGADSDFLQFAQQLSPCTPAEWKLRALQWLGAYTNTLYALRLYVPLNELLLIVPEILQEPTNPVQPRAADISYEKQMTYVFCGTCPKSELITAVPRGTGVEAPIVGRAGAGGHRGVGYQRGLLDPLRAIRQAALAALRAHRQRRQQQTRQRRRRRLRQGVYAPSRQRAAGGGGVGGVDSVADEDAAYSDRSNGGSSSSSDSIAGRGAPSDALPYTTSSDDDEDGVPTPLIIELPAVVGKGGLVATSSPVRGARVGEGGEGTPRLRDSAAFAASSHANAPWSATGTVAHNQETNVDDAELGADSTAIEGDNKDVASWASTCASADDVRDADENVDQPALTAHSLQRLRGNKPSGSDDVGNESGSDEANLLAIARPHDSAGDGIRDDGPHALGMEADYRSGTAVALMRGHRLPENAVCPTCCDTQAMRCVICEEVVEGLFYWLRSCGHGGHVQHMEEWLQLADECPRCGVPVSEVMRTAA